MKIPIYLYCAGNYSCSNLLYEINPTLGTMQYKKADKEQMVSEIGKPLLKPLKLAMVIFCVLFFLLQIITFIFCGRDIFYLSLLAGTVSLSTIYLITVSIKSNIKKQLKI